MLGPFFWYGGSWLKYHLVVVGFLSRDTPGVVGHPAIGALAQQRGLGFIGFGLKSSRGRVLVFDTIGKKRGVQGPGGETELKGTKRNADSASGELYFFGATRAQVQSDSQECKKCLSVLFSKVTLYTRLGTALGPPET